MTNVTKSREIMLQRVEERFRAGTISTKDIEFLLEHGRWGILCAEIADADFEESESYRIDAESALFRLEIENHELKETLKDVPH